MKEPRPPKPALTRRAMLRGAGGVTLGLPLLDIMGCKKDRLSDLVGGGVTENTSALTGPKRLVFFMTENGTDPRIHFPTGTETSFTFPAITAPLAPLKQNLVFTKGIDNKAALATPGGNTHYTSWTTQITGRQASGSNNDFVSGGGISLDQFVANQVGTSTRFKSLEFGYNHFYGSGRRINFYGPNQPVPIEGRPESFFDRVFAGVSGGGGGGPPDPAAERLRKNRQSVLDAVQPQFSLLNSRLGTADRQRMADHLDKVRDLETRVTAPPPVAATCTVPARPDDNAFENSSGDSDVGFDLMAYALGCDLTRVATVMFDMYSYENLGVPGNYHDDWLHNVLSSSEAAGHVRTVKSWITQRLVDFVNKLKAIPEGGGTVFDNTLIVWCDEYCHGYEHKVNEIPYVLLSGGNDFFQMGRFLDYGAGVSSNQLWLSIRDAMGATGAFGDPALGTTPLARL